MLFDISSLLVCHRVVFIQTESYPIAGNRVIKTLPPSVIGRCIDMFPFVLYKPEVWFKSFASGRVYVIITSRRYRKSEIFDG